MGSLRAAIAAASNGDTIIFASSLNNQTITLTSGELVIDKSLDIEGLGANKLTVSGNDATRVFDISSGVKGRGRLLRSAFAASSRSSFSSVSKSGAETLGRSPLRTSLAIW